MLMTPEIGEIPFFEPEEIPVSRWRDGLLVRSPNWLGDAVMSIPALTMLRGIVPEFCGLFVAAPAGIAPLFKALPFVDKVIPLSNPHAFPTAREKQQIRRLIAGPCVLFNNSFRDALAIRFASAGTLYGAAARYRSFLLKRAFQFPPRLDHTLNKPHQAAKYMAIAAALGAKPWNGVMPELVPDVWPETLSAELQKALEMKGPLLAVAAGAAYGDAKRWNEESFREICRLWITERKGSVLMLGSAKERTAAERITEGLSGSFNLAGKTSLDELMYVLKHVSACLANDSGVMHLAAAAGTPGVAPFGPTDPAATSPLSKKWRIVFEKQNCSPCFKRVCPYGTKACFEPVTPESVWSALNEVCSQV